ncbi:MAG: hypothetical protein QXF67_04495, partial [Candidatus Anstonellales archaeon]
NGGREIIERMARNDATKEGKPTGAPNHRRASSFWDFTAASTSSVGDEEREIIERMARNDATNGGREIIERMARNDATKEGKPTGAPNHRRASSFWDFTAASTSSVRGRES